MKIKKLFPLFLCLAGSVCALSGCKDDNNPTPGGDVVNPDEKPSTQPEEQKPDPETPPEEQEPEPEPEVVDELFGSLKEVKIESLYDGLVALYQTKNYTLEIVHEYGSFREDIPNKIFSKKFIGYDGDFFEDLDVLYNDGEGIYHVGFSDDFMSGEYLKDKKGEKYDNLWDNKLVHTMYGQCGAYIKKNITKDTETIEIADKEYKLAFMRTVIGNVNNYSEIKSLSASYTNGAVYFDLKFNNATKDTYVVTLKNVGNTKSDHLKLYTETEGKAFEPNNDLSEMRRLLYKDNYVQRNYMINEGEGYWIGYSFFTEHYFFTTGSDPFVGNAYMEFEYKEDPTIDNDFDLSGIYLVNVSRAENGQYVAYLASNRAYNSDTSEIEECVKYPSIKLSLLSNLEYVKAGEVRDADYDISAQFFTETEPSQYYFIDEKLVNNFVNNCGLDTAFEGVEFNTVAIEIGLAEKDEDCVVVFHAIGYYPGDGETYDILIPFFNFGAAYRPALDTLYSQYNNKTN